MPVSETGNRPVGQTKDLTVERCLRREQPRQIRRREGQRRNQRPEARADRAGPGGLRPSRASNAFALMDFVIPYGNCNLRRA